MTFFSLSFRAFSLFCLSALDRGICKGDPRDALRPRMTIKKKAPEDDNKKKNAPEDG